MGHQSSIEWTDHTFNPWWGCVKVSEGCLNCYAESWAKRYGHDLWGTQKVRRTFSKNHWNQPHKWNKIAGKEGCRFRVFCASMADVFEDNPFVIDERERLWQMISETPNLDWLLLTKRPENMLSMVPWGQKWPSNVWAMTTAENQQQANLRIPILLDIPAIVHGLSIEPLLGPLNLRPWLDGIDWVIVGGESGNGSRPMHPEWIRSIRDQCIENNVAFFFKQWGCWIPDPNGTTKISSKHDSTECIAYMKKVSKKNGGRILDNKEWNEVPTIEVH